MNLKQLSKQEKVKVRNAQIQAAGYAVICLGACWLVVFAVTGSVLRALMFIVGLLLISISSSQFNAITHRIKLITMSPYMQQFEEWLTSHEKSSVFIAGEDLEPGDMLYKADDGTFKKLKTKKPE